jgi:hypothetical protein
MDIIKVLSIIEVLGIDFDDKADIKFLYERKLELQALRRIQLKTDYRIDWRFTKLDRWADGFGEACRIQSMIQQE